MRRGIVAAALVVSTVVAPVQAIEISVLMPSPVSLVLTVGQWLMKDREEVYYVRVRATGRDEQDARNQAFRLATEQAIGSLVLSNTRVQDGDLKQHEIINYSSGHVYDFNILDRQNNGTQITVDVDVWIKKSSISGRLMGDSGTDGTVDGDKIAESYRSAQRERQQGDRVLGAVLADYPARAYDISISSLTPTMTSDRSLKMVLDFSVRWNHKYVRALLESLTAVSQKSDAQRCWKRPSSCEYNHVIKVEYKPEENAFFRDVRYLAFSDQSRINQLKTLTVGIHPVLKVTVHDGFGKTAYLGCFSQPELAGHPTRSFIYVYDRTTHIDGDLMVNAQLDFSIKPSEIEYARKVDLRVVPASECRR